MWLRFRTCVIQAAVTQVSKNSPYDDIKESIHKLADPLKCCFGLYGDHFE